MSDIFEMQEDGVLCSECCGYIQPPKGYMSKCEDCEDNKKRNKERKKSKAVKL